MVILQKGVKISASISPIIKVTQKGQMPDQLLSRTIESEETSRRVAIQIQATDKNQYAVEQIVRHVTMETGPHYVE